MIFNKLKGKTKIETVENYLIVLIFVGAGLLSAGIGLTIFNPQGFSVILAMAGAVASFLFTIILIFLWVFREFVEKHE